ncbi:nuclear pore-associated protein [Ephemerocybe angulata]|uniref:Nuclear pore-associated protein n=1 Tax=Ephemerocybe angulata TaxID=980116 RepID=A0A8H6M5Z6_9AGAR|nr:nuclear pore-associated protein [Tulosesus angulatus]
MEVSFSHPRGIGRGRGGYSGDSGGRGRPLSRNKQWVAGEGSRPQAPPVAHTEGERWERGGLRGRGRGRGLSRGGAPVRKFPNATLRVSHSNPAVAEVPTAPVAPQVGIDDDDDNDEPLPEIHEPVLETPEERNAFWQKLVAEREQERKQAIAEGKMDDPLVPKRLEDAINIVGTCPDMCPRFERYRRERENNLFYPWEVLPTEGKERRVDHQRAVKIYERAAGDKVLPSDIRPPHVLKKTLDYLFHDLLPRGTIGETASFIRDRSRAVRNDFTMQHITGPTAIKCHDRCARFHILAMHTERDRPGFSLALEEQQLMNTLQSLKEFYDDQRGKYNSPTELEMRVYHRLIHIRDQKERHQNIPDHILNHPIFQLTTEFRLRVQEQSSPITKTSALKVDAVGLEIFSRLVGVLRQMGNTVMIYLVACIVERLFGKDTIEDIEDLRQGLSLPDIIDGKSGVVSEVTLVQDDQEMQEDDIEGAQDEEEADSLDRFLEDEPEAEPEPPTLTASTSWPAMTSSGIFGPKPSTPSPFGPPASTSVFSSSQSAPAIPQASAFSNITTSSAPSAFGTFGAPVSSSQFATSVSNTFPSVSSTSTPPSNSLPVFPPSLSQPSLAAPQPVSFVPSKPPAEAPKPSIFSSPPVSTPQPNPTPAFSSTPTFNGNAFQLPNGNLNAKAPSFTPSNAFTLPPQKPSIAEPQRSDDQPKATAPITFQKVVAPPSLAERTRSASTSGSRASPPPPLKIDTALSTSSITSTTGATTTLPPPTIPPSPREPPALNRVQPVSLPSTPTTLAGPPSALLTHLKGALGTPPSSGGFERSGFLSPLVLQTPKTSAFPPNLNNFSPGPQPGSSSLKTYFGPTGFAAPAVTLDKGKGKQSVRNNLDNLVDLPPEVLNLLQDKAASFNNRSIVKRWYKRWMDRIMEKAEQYEAAVEKENAYREKVRAQKGQEKGKQRERPLNGSVNGAGTPERKRSRPEGESPQRKKPRKRVSSVPQANLTDEERTRRFQETKQAAARRWAQRSLLDVCEKVYRTLSSSLSPSKHQQPFTPPSTRQIWLSMNPESDATAIWIECKFDVPTSGKWLSEAVFSIPIGAPPEGAGAMGHPGLVVFECTPLEGIDDELERKYRVLDDCTRLRDVVKAFPSRRYYTPSVLLLCWAHDTKQYSDIITMVEKLVDEGTIKGYNAVLFNAKDKDPEGDFEKALRETNLDLEGELVKAFSVRDLFKSFSAVLNPFLSEWVNTCSNGDDFNWKLYNCLVHVTVALLNGVVANMRQLSGIADSSSSLGLLPFEDETVDDSDSAYEYAEEWLAEMSSRIDISLVLVDIESHRNIEQDFPARAFLDHLLEIAQVDAEQALGGGKLANGTSNKKHLVLKAELAESTESLEEALSPLRVRLSHRLSKTVRRNPKRRSYSTAASDITSPESKRMRLTGSPSVNGGHSLALTITANGLEGNGGPLSGRSPSPSVLSLGSSMADESRRSQTPGAEGGAKKPPVTAAMLRALTKDLKKKYMRS